MNMELIHNKPDMTTVPGGWEYEAKDFEITKNHFIESDGENIDLLYNALTEQECEQLISIMNQSPNKEKVSVYGLKDFKSDEIGSERTTIWSESISKQLWTVFKHKLKLKITTPFSFTDSWQEKDRYEPSNTWKPIACSPMLRFMKYEKGGKHNAHYDAGFFYPGGKIRTLKSFVIYLNTIETNKGGHTRFIDDDHINFSVLPCNRNYNDWTIETPEHLVLQSIQPQQGNILVFDHNLCHDVSEYTGQGSRIIIRGDVIYQNITEDEF